MINDRSYEEQLSELIESLEMPAVIKEDLKRNYAIHRAILPRRKQDAEPRTVKTKSMVKMSSKDGRKAAIILWSDEMVTVIATSKDGKSHISTTNSPDVYYMAQKQYIDQGLEINYAEEDGKEIGIR